MRLHWITAAAILASANATAGIEQEISVCAKNTDKLDRLICYDALAKKSNTTDITTLATSAVIETSTVKQQHPVTFSSNIENEFGQPKKTEIDTIEKIYLDITSLTKDQYGALKIKFSNGQIWKQTDGRNYKIAPEQTVFIKKAALGSFILGSDERNTTIRVKRLQ
ncbi:hypothetical protein HQQ94_03400 [Shewanella sp. VB17]|uniref:hypothetical protein n=1 Tax=Shewanella sp. VB17 TaxID=2739432 RepID=UPI0015658D03|nr:hypothetical protein [Shewanella sp. VB17]NRD72301.1 hypothetical protein [Shewanella sp. VB17]